MAWTLLSEPSVRLQLVPEAESQPDQPAKTDPLPAVAVSVTDAPSGIVSLHVAPQLIPFPETVPEPTPAVDTLRTWLLVPPSPPDPPGPEPHPRIASAQSRPTTSAASPGFLCMAFVSASRFCEGCAKAKRPDSREEARSAESRQASCLDSSPGLPVDR